jgi:hypothetical protein
VRLVICEIERTNALLRIGDEQDIAERRSQAA